MMKTKFIVLTGAFIMSILFSLKINAQCYYAQATTFWAKAKTTGIADLDNVINNENTLLKAVFGVNIDLYVGGDYVNNENAMFAPGCNFVNCEGEIWLGLNLMSQLFKKTHGIERLKAIFAHEYAHALQKRWGFAGYGKYPELHADFLAGYYTGVKGAVSSDLLDAFVKEFYSQGDTYFFSAGHHGTGTERGCAFIEGYKIATVNHYNTYQAYLAGIDYIRINNPCISFKSTKQYETNPTQITNVEKGNVEITSEKKSLRLVNNLRQIIGYTSPNSSYKAENVQAGVYYITPKFEGFMGTYALPTIPIEVKPNTKVIVNITKVRNFFSISCNISYRYIELPKPIDYYKDGFDAYQAKNFNSALENLTNEINSHPTNYNAYFFRAICKSQLNDRKGSIEDLKIILEHNDEILNPVFLLGTIYNNIGYSYVELNDITSAEPYIKKALEINPFEAYIWGSSGTLNFKKGNYDQCIKDMARSIELTDSKLSQAPTLENQGYSYYYRGIAYLKLKKNKLACADLLKAKEFGYKLAEQEYLNNCGKK